MKVAIVGSGAMGSLFGGLMTSVGEDVKLFDVWSEHVEAINEKGLRINGVSGKRTVKVAATSDPRQVGIVDLILIFVKAHDTLQATRDALQMASDETVFLTLQNGLGNLERITEVVGEHRVMGGVTSHASTLLGPGEIYHAGRGPTFIGELDGKITSRARRVEKAFNKAGIPVEISTQIQGAIWSKVLVNVGINSLTALTGLKNGELLQISEIKNVMKMAVEEAVEIAQKLGVSIDLDDPIETVYNVAEATALNRSSMLQDVDRGRKTEVSALNGAIVKLGKRLGISTPINETLTAAVLGLEYSRMS